MTQVISRLQGGLGNQMFQYAAGHALAEYLKVPLLLDRTFLDFRPADMIWTPRPFELDVFKAPSTFASTEMVERMRRKPTLPFLHRSEQYKEIGKTFNEALFQQRAPVLIDGYWQCERYFLACPDALRKDHFVPIDNPSAENASLCAMITSSKSASLHVRRGDYVTNLEAGRFHGMPGLSYYTNAAEELHQRCGVESFFVFSDDPAWVKENVRLPFAVTHVSHNHDRESHWDLWLMKHCRHHIIANSSFSWWGAWLNDRADKTVIAPKNWFADGGIKHDILPSSWLTR